MMRLLLPAVLAVFAPPPALGAAPGGGWGINLHGVRYWSPALPFVDVAKQAGEWIPQRRGSQTWSTGERLDLDADGWLRSLSPGQEAASIVMAGARYPAGRYIVSYDGEGELFFGLDAAIAGRRGRDLVVEVKPRASVLLKILATNRADPVRNIRMYLPGFDPANAPVFNPAYIDYLRGFKVVRFMDWANANDSDVVEWRTRTRTEHPNQSRKAGAALEYMIRLAAALDADPWFTVPYAADDDYVRSMAELIKRHIAPQRKFYLEYSNEVWNAMFPQHAHAAREAARLSLGDADEYYVRRSLAVFGIFEQVFGGASGFVRVLSGQAVNFWRAKKLLARPGLARRADAYAIAPYFDDQFHLGGKRGLDRRTARIEDVLDWLEQNLEQTTRAVIRTNVSLARQAGLQFIAYEGGQHVTNVPGREDFCAAVNRHPRMEALYRKYLGIWEEETSGALMALFADMSAYGPPGCWGLSEYHGQPLADAPKLRVVRQRLRRTGARP